jgi:hypothetical protein
VTLTPTMTARRTLALLGACHDALAWIETACAAGDEATRESLWRNCHRGDWMLWFLGRLAPERHSPERLRLVKACAEIARSEILSRTADGDQLRKSTLWLVRVAEDFAEGKVDADRAASERYVSMLCCADRKVPGYWLSYFARSLVDLATALYEIELDGHDFACAFGDLVVGYDADEEDSSYAAALAVLAAKLREFYPEAPAVPDSFLVRGGYGSRVESLEA